jgi:precorrin-3B synthase
MSPAHPEPPAAGDRCPGVLRVHEAADGGVARVRLPGGLVSAAQLAALAGAATQLGDGALELTSRGNVQLRGLAAGVEETLAGRLAPVGLLPSATHERVRNIVASPLAGIDTPDDLAPLVVRCDTALREVPRLSELSGRFLIALDDGRWDVARLDADVVAVTRGARAWVGALDVPAEQTVAAVVAVAVAFLDERGAQGSAAWRVRELDGGLDRVCRRAARAIPGARPRPVAAPPAAAPPAAAPPAAGPAEPVGAIPQADGGTALAVVAPLGRLGAGQASLLADLAGPRGLRVTPWRSVVVPDVTDLAAATAAAAQAGFGVDAASPWYRVSSCVGRPGCAKALADVRSDATAGPNRWPGRQVRWSGCERRCGRPADTEIDVVATPGGYRVSAVA